MHPSLRSSLGLGVLATLLTAVPGTAQYVVGAADARFADADGLLVPVELEISAADVPARSALWVFAKFQDESGNWRDVRWAESGHALASTSGEAVVSPGTGGPFVPGVFLESPSGGPVEWSATLQWDLSTSGVELGMNGFELMVMTVEMIRVPEGSFTAGDGQASSEISTFFGPDGAPVTIESEAAISVGEGSGLSYAASDFGGDLAGPIPEEYPKGFAGFFVMRRELTDGQYASFLSTLSGRALASRDITQTPGYADAGGSIRVDEFVSAGDPDRPASHVTWADAIAWAAWAGLRPMSELEFEKVARRADEWRVEAMLGGRWERVVTLGTPEGRRFRGSHGLGFLDELAQPFVFLNWDWPGPMAAGSGFRGGADGLADFSTPGNRVYGAYDATYGGENEGFRAVRTAPSEGSSQE